MMIIAADVSSVTKPWLYQANIDQLVYATYNEVMTDTVSASYRSVTVTFSHKILILSTELTSFVAHHKRTKLS